MPDQRLEEISDDFRSSGPSFLQKIMKKIPLLITGIVVIIVIAYVLTIKVIAPLLKDKPEKIASTVETLRPKENPQEVIQKTNEGDEVPKEEKRALLTVFVFPEEFVINPLIRDENDEIGVLIIKLSIEIEPPETVSEVEQRNAQLRDKVIELISNRTMKELNLPETRVRVKNEIMKEFNRILMNGKVISVFFEKYQFQIM